MSKTIPNLLSLFQSLSDVRELGDIYSAQQIAGWPSYRIAKDACGNATLLIAAFVGDQDSTCAAMELRNISYRPRRVCRVGSPLGRESIETLAVLKCSTDELALREYFLRALSVVLAVLSPDSPSEAEITAAVSKLVELFRCLEEPPQSSIQGLWCELLLIANAGNIPLAVDAWHAEPRALHDFSLGEQRVEVKSTTRPRRAHEFLMDQLLAPDGTEIIVASFMVQESLTGPTIQDLSEQIISTGALSASQSQRLLRIISLSLGQDWRQASRVAFDPESALKRLHFYTASTIPKIGMPLPLRVSEIRFKSDLTDVIPVARSTVLRCGGLFAGLLR